MEASAQGQGPAAWPAWQERDGKRVWTRGGQHWGQSRAQRDSRGKFLPAQPLDEAGEAERERRLARDRDLRKQAQDQRTAIARRARTIEGQLRAQLRRQGRAILVHDELTINHAAQLAVRLEILRAEQSRGLHVDDDSVTRYVNAVQRALARLGLRSSLLDGERVPRGLGVARQRWSEQAAQTADQREASATTKDTSPDDRLRATTD
jgi:hypothetical protein